MIPTATTAKNVLFFIYSCSTPNDYNCVISHAGSAGNDPYDPVVRSICDDIMGPSVFNTVKSRAQG
jgi:hypothetical protein